MSDDPLESLAKRHRLSPAALEDLRRLWFGVAPTRPPELGSTSSDTVHLDSFGASLALISTEETTRVQVTPTVPAARERYVDLGPAR